MSKPNAVNPLELVEKYIGIERDLKQQELSEASTALSNIVDIEDLRSRANNVESDEFLKVLKLHVGR
jgi:hypothetical protein